MNRLTCLLAAALLLGGCTRVAFRSPVGKPVAAADEDELKGEWLGGKGVVYTVDRDAASGRLRVSYVSGGKTETRLLVLTSLSSTLNLVWEKEDDLSAYVPLRMAGGDDAMALLYPDEAAVKKLVAEGKLTAAFNDKEKAWVVAEGDWSAVLERADFWKLDTSLPLVRPPPTKTPAAAPLPKPASP
jgi:hypothetical protein